MRHRIVFYAHDSFGLGHLRRTLTIASYLARHIDDLSVLMLTGLDSAAAFEVPRGIDFVKLPSIWKSGAEEYRSRHLRVSFQRVRRIRENLLRTVVRAFDPRLLVVDNVPRGVEGELLPTLRFLRRNRPEVGIALTLRDVLDEPDEIRRTWRRNGVYDCIQRFYDEVWVAGSRDLFDPVQLYDFPKKVARRTRFVGYVSRFSPRGAVDELRREFRLDARPIVVVSCGGGGDGYAMLDAYEQALDLVPRERFQSVVFLGPDMPHDLRRQLKMRFLARADDCLTFEFRPDLVSFLDLATASISMGGYNTMCELAALRKPALIVPRTTPRIEQLLRAEAFEDRGLVHVLTPDRLSPASMSDAVMRLLNSAEAGAFAASVPLDLGGLRRITRRVRRILEIAEPDEGEEHEHAAARS